ncbi:unnamed protein product, partial [Sphagnum jensenii]
MAKTMQVVQYSTFGGGAAALQHAEVPVPTPGKEQVLVKVEAAAVNPVDWKFQQGIFRPLGPAKLPCIPGIDIAGEVVGLGPGVTSFKVGDKVVALLEFLKGGSLAEYAVASIKTTAKRPDEIPATDAAPLGVGGTTALQTIRDAAGIKFDGSNQVTKNVLITAASGGVGTYAVQLAKLAGVHVTATCGARNIDLIKSLGADEVLDYKTPEGKNLQSPSGKKYDVVLNYSLQPFSSFKPQLAPQGKVIDISGSPKLFLTKAIQIVTFQKQRLVPFFMANNGDDLQFVTNLVKEGKLKTIIDSTYPLSKAEDAWVRCIEGRATGKIVVTM